MRDLDEDLDAIAAWGAKPSRRCWSRASCGGSRVQAHGRRIAYAPAILPDGLACAMSVHLGLRGMVVEVER